VVCPLWVKSGHFFDESHLAICRRVADARLREPALADMMHGGEYSHFIAGVRNDPHEMTVDGMKALAFHGFDAAMGQTSEVWFIKNHFLYEVSTYKELESWPVMALGRLRFTPASRLRRSSTDVC
jgi:hypothetical protein